MKKINKKTGLFLLGILCVIVLAGGNLSGCTGKNNLFNQMIQLIEEDEMIQFIISSDCKPYNSEEELYEITSGQADLANVTSLFLPEEVEKEYQMIEALISQEAEVDEELLARKRSIDAVLNQNLMEINQYHDELSNQIVSILNDVKLKNKEKFEVIKDDEIIANIVLEYEDGKIVRTDFYQSGQLMVRTGKRSVTAFIVDKKEIYEYNLDAVYEIGNLLKEYNYWRNGPGKLINEYHVLDIE